VGVTNSGFFTTELFFDSDSRTIVVFDRPRRRKMRTLTKVVRSLLLGLAVTAMALVVACAGASNGGGADEAESSTSRRDRGTARDLSICPNDCFLNEGRCFMVPTEDPEEMRGDEVPILEPEPCDPRCCEGS
jgi:hypothetical protein